MTSRAETKHASELRASALGRTADAEWRRRALAVIPGGMYGHVHVEELPEGYPQFFGKSSGSKVWDVDGHEYVDLMCAWGPMILGYGNADVSAAFNAELADRDLSGGPSPRAVELAERFVEVIAHADWAMFAKNGGDVTTLAVSIARAATGRRKVLKAAKAYHGSLPWCNPVLAGVTPEDRANLIEFVYNDVQSLEAAVAAAGDDFAALIVTPHSHEVHADQAPVDPAFARRAREICDKHGATLILDDVRAGFRTSLHGSWEPIGVRPDLTAFSKCIANGYPLAALTGVDSLRGAARSVYATGSFWYGSGALAAGLRCLDLLVELDAPSLINRVGDRLVDGLRAQAKSHGLDVVVSGPGSMPFLRFVDGDPMEYAYIWSAEALRRGVYLHPWHNWFVSAAHTDADMDRALEATDGAFAYLASRL